jgi:hypothetical protein
MTSINDIQTYEVTYIWKDDEKQTKHWGVIGVASGEVLETLLENLEADDDEWTAFDEDIFYYIDTSAGESLEATKNFDAPYEFLVVEDEN